MGAGCVSFAYGIHPTKWGSWCISYQYFAAGVHPRRAHSAPLFHREVHLPTRWWDWGRGRAGKPLPHISRILTRGCIAPHSSPRNRIDVLMCTVSLTVIAHIRYLIRCERGSAAVLRTTCCSYGKVQILHLSRAETTQPINTKFWTIDYLGEIKRIAKFGYDRFKGSVSPCGWNIQYPVFSSGLLWSGYRPQFATDFIWLKRFGLAQGCAF